MAMRPTVELVPALSARHLEDVEAFVGLARAALATAPPPGSYLDTLNTRAGRIASKVERTCALSVILHAGTTVTKTLWNVRDHAISFDAALHDGRRPTTSLMTLGRGMLEGVLTVAHLLEPVGPDRSLARGMAAWLESMEESLDTARRLPSGASVKPAQLEKRVRDAYRDFGLGGFQTVQSTKKPLQTTRVIYRGEEVVVAQKITDLAAHFMPTSRHLYPIMSGPAHSKSWYLGGAFKLGDEPGDFATYEQAWVSAMQFAFDITDLLAQSLAGALDLDAQPLLKRTHTRRRALLASMDGGHYSPMSLEDYRAAPGVEPEQGGGAFGLKRHK